MVLSEGKIVAKGTPQELVKNTKAIEAYFGEGFKILISCEKSSKNKNQLNHLKKNFCI